MSKKISLTINGNKVVTDAGKSILQVCNDIGIHIPTLCYEPELNATGSCWVCSVKMEGVNGFVTSCGTEARDGMSVITDSPEVHKARKTALELLLSEHCADCEAPCKIACPAHVDVQSYVSLTANGQRREAMKTIMKNLPMPMSVGRICPAFCEEECRRKLVDDAVAIRQIKRYDADIQLDEDWCYIPEKEPDKGKHIAIVGAGPGGLSCGYFLTQKGYDVTVFEAAPKAGGWLRYGIPEYRLPKDILDREIDIISRNGMKIRTGTALGKDIYLKELSEKYDAVYLSIGAQLPVPLRFDTRNLKGIQLGVDYLREVAVYGQPDLGKKVAVVGGGNTAIDCARTARRSGADVTVLYRRTQKEMPAEHLEISDAMDEGVTFEFLVNPVDVTGKNGQLETVLIDIMELGDEDASGRRRPVSTGKTKTVHYDSLIAAVSQKVDVSWMEDERNNLKDGMPLTKWNTFQIDTATMHWSENCFAGGDAQRGPATAIETIADAKIAARSIHRWLQGEIMSVKPQFDSKKAKSITDMDAAEFAHYTKKQRIMARVLDPVNRSRGTEEVEKTFTKDEAEKEASRCLECGCMVNTECKLRQYATEYEADQTRFAGEMIHHPISEDHPFILRDPNKCIKCGRCIRTCAEVQGPAVLGYIYRGFTSVVGPDFGLSLQETACVSCGKCIDVCPTGALLPRTQHYKQNPTAFKDKLSRCSDCGLACETKLRFSEDRLVRVDAAPDNGYNGRELCYEGRFGWQNNDTRIMDMQDIISSAAQTGRPVCLSGDLSCEELDEALSLSLKMETAVRAIGIVEDISDSRPDLIAKMQDIDNASRIIIVGKIKQVLKSKSRLAQLHHGSEIVMIDPEKDRFSRYADITAATFDELTDSLDNEVIIYERETLSDKHRRCVDHYVSAHPSVKIWANSRYVNVRGLIGRKLEKYESGDVPPLVISRHEHEELSPDAERVSPHDSHRVKGHVICDTGEKVTFQ